MNSSGFSGASTQCQYKLRKKKEMYTTAMTSTTCARILTKAYYEPLHGTTIRNTTRTGRFHNNASGNQTRRIAGSRTIHILRADEENDDQRPKYTSIGISNIMTQRIIPMHTRTTQRGALCNTYIPKSTLRNLMNTRELGTWSRMGSHSSGTIAHNSITLYGKNHFSQLSSNRNGDDINPPTPLSSSSTKLSKNDNNKMKDAARKSGKVVKKGARSLRELAQKYGWTFFASYFTVYLITLSTLFTGLDCGYIDPATLTDIQFQLPWHSGTGAEEAAAKADAKEFRSSVKMIAEYIERFEWTTRLAEAVEKNPHLSNLAIAWVATKFTEPVRLPLTLAITPRVAKFFGQKTEDDEDDVVGDDGEPTPIK